MKQRLLGLFLLGVGGLLAYLCVYSPLEAARQHEEKVSLSLKGALLCPIGVIFGVFYLVYGKSTEELLGTRQRPKGAVYLLAIIAVGAGLLLYCWINSQLEQAGYEF
jgi:protein-S-isoprenylcysteine O-methyltransferase Ste14